MPSDSCPSRHRTVRRLTRVVNVGGVGVGGNNPIRVQSMTTSDTEDVAATVSQARPGTSPLISRFGWLSVTGCSALFSAVAIAAPSSPSTASVSSSVSCGFVRSWRL